MKKFMQDKIARLAGETQDPAGQSSQGSSSSSITPWQRQLPRGSPPASSSPSDGDVCRDYIRGSCTRRSCKYRHKYHPIERRGVYRFCHNYQNSVCRVPNCRFVHATTFEEAGYYRTGFLPPRATAHTRRPPLPPSVQDGAEAELQRTGLVPPDTRLLPPPPPPSDMRAVFEEAMFQRTGLVPPTDVTMQRLRPPPSDMRAGGVPVHSNFPDRSASHLDHTREFSNGKSSESALQVLSSYRQ